MKSVPTTSESIPRCLLTSARQRCVRIDARGMGHREMPALRIEEVEIQRLRKVAKQFDAFFVKLGPFWVR